MKQKEIALLILFGGIAAVISIILSGILITPKKDQVQKAEVVAPITANFPKPDAKYFNKDSINPTKKITIGDSSNPSPF